MNEHVKQTLDAVLERFRSDEIPEAVAYAMFPIPDLPSTRWSILNRTIMLINGTCDAQGISAVAAGSKRFVRKGGQGALHILMPADPEERSTARTMQRKVHRLRLQSCQAVFRVEDTDGEPLEYENLDPGPHTADRARSSEWGITVRAVPHVFPLCRLLRPGSAMKSAWPRRRRSFSSTSWRMWRMRRSLAP